ncbi:MAG: hypothetical protein GY866_19690 [Proteobacteria bacterium]|nr:hypothetical protein [Pseudomonadota bacterium]
MEKKGNGSTKKKNKKANKKENNSIKIDKVSLEFRELIRDHLNLVKKPKGDTSLASYEEIEENNRINLYIVAYNIAFLVYDFADIDAPIRSNNVKWAAKEVTKAVSMGDKGRVLDKIQYYVLRDKIREVLQNINSELVRIDDQATDVWKHAYDQFSKVLKQSGLPKEMR